VSMLRFDSKGKLIELYFPLVSGKGVVRNKSTQGHLSR